MKTQSVKGYIFDKYLNDVAYRVMTQTTTPDDTLVVLKFQQAIQSKVNALRDWERFKGTTDENTKKKSNKS
jgi:hypothetical protein